MPYLRNEFFTGRDAILIQLHDTLGQTDTAALSQSQAIHGLGGVGKTQTAVEYAYRYFQQESGYDWVLWVNASSLTLAGSFGAIATDLALPNHRENKLDENIAAVKRWLSTSDRWLLIFDDVDDPDAVQPFLPNAPNGRILITSRLPRLERLGVGQSIALDTLAPEEAHTFLERRTQRDTLDSPEQQALETLAQELGYLPLALEQAAAYIQTKGVSFAVYLRSYQQRRLQVLEKEQPQMGNYPASVATTWQINFEAVQASSPAAADVLQLSAFLAPDNIPYEILSLGKDHLGETLATALAEVAEDELIIPELLAELTRYSLIRLETDDRYSIHRMVQEVLRDRLTPEQRQQWLDRTVNALNTTFPSPEFKNWQRCRRLVEQVQAIDRQQATETLNLAFLLNQIGYFLYEQRRYREVKPLYVQALEIRKSVLGEDHLSTAQSLNNLAELYKSEGHYRDAELLYLKALQIWQLRLGEEHPDTATSLNNLAGLYEIQGLNKEAEHLYLKALIIRRYHFGEDHLNTAFSLNNLAFLYQSQCRYGEAEPLYQKALKIMCSWLGEDHPHIAASLNNLAELYREQSRYEDAEPLYWQALQIRRSQLGEDHLDTAQSLNNLALLHNDQGKYKEAETLYLKALSILFGQLGENHPNTQTTLQNFVYFLGQVMIAERTADMSKHPLTQDVLAQLQQG
ncbi:FxSxx-COOH system tetratricopeptide repeat protein [Leptolyngbya sp. CCNP1308]|nr:FxSxx-COOH system tetratricopeptide repeat protein [Leptolyngbya sp. CCNP1308]